MKILIAGDGKVGETLAETLSSEGHNITLIDNCKTTLSASMERLDVMALEGNSAHVGTLREAGADSAELLIACTGTDEVNLLTCMTAHRLNPSLHTIARIRNPEYVEQAYEMRDDFGLSMIFNPEKQTAAEIERLLKYPAFLKRDSFAKGRVEIVELRIDEDSSLCGVSLPDLYSIIKCKVLVCAVLRDGVCFTPNGSFTLREGDRIFVTAPMENLTKLLKNLGIVTHKSRRVLIAGGGTVSFYLATSLLRNHIDVEILEKDEARCHALASLLPKAGIIHGDATDRQVLDAEHMNDCDALVTLTGVDEMNLIISLFGSASGVPAVITKLGRMDDSTLLDGLAVGSIVSPRKLCCSNVVRYVRAMQNGSGSALTIHTIADGLAEATEFAVDKSTLHCGEPLKKLALKKGILIACITRGDMVEIPGGDSSFRSGDHVVVVASGKGTILQLNDIFE